MKTLTVFTPTFNRAYCLPILYNSLVAQTSQDFLWLVIDDGSTDSTRLLVEGWIAENKIAIQYVYKKNGGMHTGHNAAYERITTELNTCIDSDDYMPVDAVEKIISLWKRDGGTQYAGIVGLDLTPDGKVCGTSFPDYLKETTYCELAPVHGVICDKKFVYRTDIIKKLQPYPEFEGEKFVPLYYPILVDSFHKVLCYNEPFCIVDYQPDGSSVNIFKSYVKNPKGFAYSRIIEMKYDPFWSRKIKSAIHYVSSAIFSRNWRFLNDSPKKLLTILAIPFGVVLHFYIKKRQNAKRTLDSVTSGK